MLSYTFYADLQSSPCQTMRMQGYIYVEAYKESHVKEAIRGLTCLLYGRGPQLVPMKEMVDAITVKGTSKGSSIGATNTQLSVRACVPLVLQHFAAAQFDDIGTFVAEEVCSNS